MKHLFFAALAAAALSSCSDSDGMTDDLQSPLSVSTQLVQSSRAMESGTDFGRGGVKLGVSLFAADGSSDYEGKTSGYVNVPYTSAFANAQTTWSSAAPIVLSGTAGRAYAYHPYSDKVTDLTAVPVESASQTDYMYSEAVPDVSAVNPQAKFTLHHALTAVDVYLKKGPDYPFPGQVTQISIQSVGFGNRGVLNTKTGEIASASVTDKNTPYQVTKNFTLSTADFTSNPCMVVPDVAVIGMPVTIQVTIDGHLYHAEGAMTTAFLPGNIYRFPLVLGAEGLVVSQVTIVPWQSKDIFTGDLGKPVQP